MNDGLLKRLRERYPEGKKVRLIQMNDIQAPPVGTIGIIKGVDDMGTIHVKWDNGSSLGLVLDAGDLFEMLP